MSNTARSGNDIASNPAWRRFAHFSHIFLRKRTLRPLYDIIQPLSRIIQVKLLRVIQERKFSQKFETDRKNLKIVKNIFLEFSNYIQTIQYFFIIQTKKN